MAEEDDSELGKCVKCGMAQCMNAGSQKVRAQLVLRGVGGNITLRAFGQVVQNIARKLTS